MDIIIHFKIFLNKFWWENYNEIDGVFKVFIFGLDQFQITINLTVYGPLCTDNIYSRNRENKSTFATHLFFPWPSKDFVDPMLY